MSILSWISLFWNLTASELSNLALFCQERFLKAWEVLFNEWEEASAMYVVKSWKLKAYKDRSDWEQTLWYISQNEFVWEMAFFDWNNTAKNRTASVKAIEDSQLLIIMNYSIIDLAKKHNDVYTKIANTIQKRRELNEHK